MKSIRDMAARDAAVFLMGTDGFYGRITAALNSGLSWGLPDVIVEKIASEAHASEQRTIQALLGMCSEYDIEPGEILDRTQHYAPDWDLQQPFSGSAESSGYHVVGAILAAMEYPMCGTSDLSQEEFDEELQTQLRALS